MGGKSGKNRGKMPNLEIEAVAVPIPSGRSLPINGHVASAAFVSNKMLRYISCSLHGSRSAPLNPFLPAVTVLSPLSTLSFLHVWF